jgi:hypothetical protein
MIEASGAPNVTSVLPMWNPKKPIPFANIRPGLAPLQHDERHSKDQHGEFQRHTDRQGQMLAPCRLQSGRLPQPGTDNGTIVAQAFA